MAMRKQLLSNNVNLVPAKQGVPVLRLNKQTSSDTYPTHGRVGMITRNHRITILLCPKAAGATIYKLKYGHRGHNQPVRMVGTQKCFITSHSGMVRMESSVLRT